MIFFNTETKEYPRHIGDLQLIYPGIQLGDPVPAPWVVVNNVEPPAYDISTECVYLIEPEIVDGQWVVKWGVRKYTEEELSIIQQSAIINQEEI